MINLIKQELNKKQLEKINKDLKFIELLINSAKEKGYRIIISGGYAVDGILGEITRYHNDIDILIYGKESDAYKAVNELLNIIGHKNKKFSEFSVENKGRKEYYHNLLVRVNGIGADIYYLQTTLDPLDRNKILVKSDGSLTNSQEFNTQQGNIASISFEIQNSLTEVVDKIYKRDYKSEPKREEISQDIENLKKIISKEEIQKALSKITNK